MHTTLNSFLLKSAPTPQPTEQEQLHKQPPMPGSQASKYNTSNTQMGGKVTLQILTQILKRYTKPMEETKKVWQVPVNNDPAAAAAKSLQSCPTLYDPADAQNRMILIKKDQEKMEMALPPPPGDGGIITQASNSGKIEKTLNMIMPLTSKVKWGLCYMHHRILTEK